MRLADNELSFAAAIPGCDVEKVDATVHGFEHGSDGFLTAGGTPDLADTTTTTEGKTTYLAEFSKGVSFHEHYNLARVVALRTAVQISYAKILGIMSD